RRPTFAVSLSKRRGVSSVPATRHPSRGSRAHTIVVLRRSIPEQSALPWSAIVGPDRGYLQTERSLPQSPRRAPRLYRCRDLPPPGDAPVPREGATPLNAANRKAPVSH